MANVDALPFFAILVVGLATAADISRTQLNADHIIGGNEVSISRHPHQISVRRKTCDECAYLHECGGSILNEDTILTAAHCVVNRVMEKLLVIAGTDNRAGSDGKVARVGKVVTHEHYNASITDYDVALLFLATPLTFDTLLVAAVSLVKTAPIVGAIASVTGWGAASEGGAAASKLQAVEVFVLDRKECIKTYGELITDTMLCAGVPAGGKDACQRDAGGPLLVEQQLAGVVSWAIGCARPEYPGVYVNVWHVREWIVLNLAANSLYELK